MLVGNLRISWVVSVMSPLRFRRIVTFLAVGHSSALFRCGSSCTSFEIGYNFADQLGLEGSSSTGFI